MRLIDADALIAEYDRVHVGEPGGARKLMEDAPTIEERNTGKWIANSDIPKECPFCGEDWDKYVFGEVWYTGEFPKFCPNCGADMREGQDG